MTIRANDVAPPLFAPGRRALVTGLLVMVTLAAFEDRAVGTILPRVTAELDGWALFGAASGAPLAALLVMTMPAGRWADRAGPARVLCLGIAAFTVSQVACALSPRMAFFVIGRAVSGAAESLIDTAVYVVVGQCLSPSLRPRMFAALAAAWTIPSLVGPPLMGAINDLAGWRFAFAGPVLVVPFAAQLVRRGLRSPGVAFDGSRPASTEAGQSRVAPWLLALGVAGMTGVGPMLSEAATRSWGQMLAVSGLALTVATTAALLPAGTMSARRGLPSIMALRLTTSLAFAGVGGLVPVLLTLKYGYGPAAAGSFLGASGVSWALGAWLNARPCLTSRPASGRLRLGATMLAVGAFGPSLLAFGGVPVWTALVLWTLAGAGMGISSATLSTEVLHLAPATHHGRMAAGQALSNAVGVAIAAAAGGGVIALGGPSTPGSAIGTVMVAELCVAVGAILLASRISPEAT